ncbi:hypothetical protein PHLCEN_2v10953 [Hermanssonia centrifuga]|uniref:Centrosomin N-terminal motif 1 domain-containing protein n=1 Tax=Hermanssonia centrifuga TaxID=98765 RepID=A0A2R6NLH4_9APHY|nr:hypothetical protein PHLCEN_2v10953 [Hermanssonia centrifuga]
MSAAMNRADTSIQSIGSQPDLSLGSFASGFSTPARNIRQPSGSTAASSAALATPSPPNAAQFSRRRLEEPTPLGKRRGLDEFDDNEGGDVLDTPGREKKWGEGLDVSAPGRPARTRSAGTKAGVNLTLRDQEKHIDSLKKENFNIKLKVHFLEERLAQLTPDQMEAALKQNIQLKIEVQQGRMETKKLRKLVLEMEKELERLQKELEKVQRGHGGRQERERELEERVEERERELREMRRRLREGADVEEVERKNAELEEELENAGVLLRENMEEMERLREVVEQREDEEGGSERWRREAEDLEAENARLIAKLEEQDDLADECESLKLELENLQRRHEASSLERSQSRAHIMHAQEEMEAVEDDLNAVRDKLAAAQIELSQKDDDIEAKNREIDELIEEHTRIVDKVEEEWRGEVEEARGQVEELKDALEQREADSKELRLHISELEAETTEMHEKFEAAFAHLEQEAEEKDAEIEAANRDIERLSEQVYRLEEENDRIREESDRLREDDAIERERLEKLSSVLKEKVADLTSQLEQLRDLYEAKRQDADDAHALKENLAQHIENLVDELNRERNTRQALEAERASLQSDYEEATRRSARSLEAKESALQSALNDLARAQALSTQRETDLAAVQSSLQAIEAESKKLGESHTEARFSLQLEVERLRRDVERLEDELKRARKELDDREGKGRDREGVLDKLYAENRDLASQLAAQTQGKINVTEKLDIVQASLKVAEAEVVNLRTKVHELEQRLSKDQRSLLTAESQYRDQLTERNTLLLTIYQYMDKILGVDKTPKKNGQAETKPFTNFGVFHDNLITRLKALSQIQLDFDKRCKEAEARYGDKLNDMRKQLDTRWRQIDKFEASVKILAEAKATWRKKLASKEGELEALKATNTELQAAITSTRKPGTVDSMELRSQTARANTAERRASNLHNLLLASEEKLTAMNQKTTVADNKWEIRVKEYETRLKQAEEKLKREKQGGRERAVELETEIKKYRKQVELAQKRIDQLNEIMESAGLSNSKGASPSR